MRGNVTGSQRQQDGLTRHFERAAAPSRFVDRSEADATTSWRKGQVVQRDKDEAVAQVSDNHNFILLNILVDRSFT